MVTICYIYKPIPKEFVGTIRFDPNDLEKSVQGQVISQTSGSGIWAHSACGQIFFFSTYFGSLFQSL